ncbi:MAG TPA: FkbM family methyltransferase, partial [Mariniphaga anaerophila]|nr:FkbM family methyltransferase [Mariniphaga anaerophila]
EDSTVIDCGANVGDITLLFAKTKAKVFSFEPDPLAYKTLKQRTAGFPNITCFQKGVGTENKITPFFFHRERTNLNHKAFSVSSSVIGKKDNIDSQNFIEIETIDLAAFIHSFIGRKGGHTQNGYRGC